MPKFTYSGDEEQVYPQYLDADKGTTLVAEPGKTYDIAQAEGHTVPGERDKDGNATVVEVELAMPPDDRWTSPSKTSKYAKGGVVNSGADQTVSSEEH